MKAKGWDDSTSKRFVPSLAIDLSSNAQRARAESAAGSRLLDFALSYLDDKLNSASVGTVE